jgi:predicted 3-demethylubiquinone-9 3-methyltransferase (glyoxalase superfamily)
MKNTIYPCLWFDGNAKEAAEFYCSLFKGSKITTENPMVAMFELNGTKMMGLNGGPMFKMNPSISMFVLCETIDETNKLWDKLLEGGKVMMPISEYPWSKRYGWIQDKFGFTWQVSVVYKEGDKAKLTPCLLFTDKMFGKAEEAINFYTSIFENSSKDTITHYDKSDPNAGKLLYSEFKLNGYQLIAMDGPGDHKYTFNEGVSFVIDCKNQKEIDYFWNKLTTGGGSEGQCGWAKDKFGVSWQVVPSNLGQLVNDPVKGQRVVQAFMKMKKFDIETLENA